MFDCLQATEKPKRRRILQESSKTAKELFKNQYFSQKKNFNIGNWIKCSSTQLHVPVLNIKDVLSNSGKSFY